MLFIIHKKIDYMITEYEDKKNGVKDLTGSKPIKNKVYGSSDMTFNVSARSAPGKAYYGEDKTQEDISAKANEIAREMGQKFKNTSQIYEVEWSVDEGKTD